MQRGKAREGDLARNKKAMAEPSCLFVTRETAAATRGRPSERMISILDTVSRRSHRARCKTACKTFQILGVNSVQKFPPRIMRSSSV